MVLMLSKDVKPLMINNHDSNKNTLIDDSNRNNNSNVNQNIGILNRILGYNGYKTSSSLLVTDAPNLNNLGKM